MCLASFAQNYVVRRICVLACNNNLFILMLYSIPLNISVTIIFFILFYPFDTTIHLFMFSSEHIHMSIKNMHSCVEYITKSRINVS